MVHVQPRARPPPVRDAALRPTPHVPAGSRRKDQAVPCGGEITLCPCPSSGGGATVPSPLHSPRCQHHAHLHNQPPAIQLSTEPGRALRGRGGVHRVYGHAWWPRDESTHSGSKTKHSLALRRVRRPECTPCRCFECGSSAAESTPRPAQRPPPRHYRTLSVQPRQEVREPERLGGWRARRTQRRLGCLPRTALTPVRQLSQRRSCSSGFKLKTRAVSAQSFVGRGT